MNNVIDMKNVRSAARLKDVHMCHKARDFEEVVGEGMKDDELGSIYFRAKIIKETIKIALFNGIKDPVDIMQYMMSRYEECGFSNYQQKRMMLIWDHRRIMRYLKGETRKPIYLKPMPVLEAGMMQYIPEVDLAFESNQHTIDLVQLKIGKPEYSSRGKKKEMERNLQLYSMILLGRRYGYKVIRAHLYYLKKTDDSMIWGNCSQLFFEPGREASNIISMTDIYDGKENQLDADMKVFIEEYIHGRESYKMAEEDCKYCKYSDICKFTLPPITIPDKISTTKKAVSLSPEQMEAVQAENGIFRVLADAGSGKTSVVANHVGYLISRGYQAEKILCVTYTKAGAEEMKERARLYAGNCVDRMHICTFHSFENEIVQENFKKLGYSRAPQIIDTVEKYAIVEKILNENPILEWSGNSFLNFDSDGGYGAKGAIQIAAEVFDEIRKEELSPAAINITSLTAYGSSDISAAALTKLVRLYGKYDAELRKNSLIEFDDQERLAWKIISDDDAYLEKRYGFQHLIIDEFQDTASGQIRLLCKLRDVQKRLYAGMSNSLMIVGDDNQAIFGSLSGTKAEYIIHFEDYIREPVKDIRISRNYRCTPEIINFANNIAKNIDDKSNKEMIPTRPSGMPVIVNGFKKPVDEYGYIIRGIQQHLKNGTAPEDIAVIAYTKAELMKIADHLTKAGIASNFGAPEPLQENSRIRAILAFAKVIQNPSNDKNILIAANALCKGDIMELPVGEMASKKMEIIQRAAEINYRLMLEEKKRLFMEYVELIEDDDEAVIYFKEKLETKDFEEILLYCRNFEKYGKKAEYRRLRRAPGIVLITAHSGKGLEYDIVYNTISKYQNSKMNARGWQEKRRLLYVSGTRARDELYVSALWEATGSKKGNLITNHYLEEAFKAAGRVYLPDI